jgi:hypothetical protein
MHRELGVTFLDRNIRYGLGTSETVNRAISKALSDIIIAEYDEPPTFTFSHNGVTLYAESVDEEIDKLILISPRLLNGAQTVTTFGKFLDDNAGSDKLALNQGRINEIAVLCKIVSNARDDFVTRVTINNNRQNPVEPWNLHANDLIQLEMQDKFREELHIYYERQENAFDQLSVEDLEEYGISTDTRAVQMLKLAQTFIVTDGNIGRISEMRRVFEDDRVYNSVFSRERLQADARHILLCYKIERRLRRLAEDIRQKWINKYYFAPRARYLIWELTCQAVLNDK